MQVTILSQMFWVAVAMLESDYDYEFFLAVKLLTRVRVRLYTQIYATLPNICIPLKIYTPKHMHPTQYTLPNIGIPLRINTQT